MNEKDLILKKVAEHHAMWVRIIKTFGESDYCEDLVQEMYILMHKYGKTEKVLNGNEVNIPYVYKTLQNIFLNFKQQQGKIKKVDIEIVKNLPEPPCMIEYIEKQTKIFKQTEEQIKHLDEYEQHLITIHVKHQKSYRDIQEATGINKDYLCKDMKAIRAKFSDVAEDYQDLKNGDLELI
jgi:DNA-directed RNA polymerase specialized sigma24 family protein